MFVSSLFSLSPETPTRRSVYGIRLPCVPSVEMGLASSFASTGRETFAGSLRPRLGDFGDSRFARPLSLLRGEMVPGQSVFQELKAFFRRIGHLEQVKVRCRNYAGIHHRFKIDDLLPISAAVDDNDNLLGQLLSLGEGENLKEFVERAESTWKNNQCFGQVCETE